VFRNLPVGGQGDAWRNALTTLILGFGAPTGAAV
jgi:hypothetical protein